MANNINPDMDIATPGALGNHMVSLKILIEKDL